MTATLDQVAADPQQPIAELLRQLDERTAERDAALAREAAVAEVLGVINSSRGDLTPVFDAMLDKAVRLCEANFGVLWRFDGEVLSPGALHQVPAAFGDFIREPRRPTPDSGPGRIMRGEGTVAVPDLMEYPPYRAGDPMVRAIVDLGGARSVMITPLRRDGITLGGITIYRQEVRPFTEKQIALLENFAAQAVIAMENARLITETREALEQQQAVAEVLHVINRSLGELQPVFDILLDKAMELCGAAFGLMRVVDGELFRTIAAHGVPADFAEFTRHNPLPPEHGGIGSRLRSGEAIVHTVDLKDGDLYRNDDPQRRALVDLGGARTSLTVALRRDGELLGAIQIYRQEVRPFGDKQIALLQNFAAQAVIAMENARLIIETREALDQQTATAEVLGVINSSPGDLAPVFDAILEKAHSLCGAAKGSLVTYDGDAFRAVATRGLSEEYAALLRASQHDSPGSPPQRLLDGESLVQIADMRALPSPVPQAAAEREGARTVLYVPLRKDSELLGYITAYRQEVRPFTDKQIALLQNFAAQAVIAMENARLITETREALEQQTATAEVLQVINSSPGDLAPVFDAILEKAHGLCGIEYGTLQLYDGVKFRAVSTRGFPELMKELVRQPYALETDNPRRVVLEQKGPVRNTQRAGDRRGGIEPEEPGRNCTRYSEHLVYSSGQRRPVIGPN